MFVDILMVQIVYLQFNSVNMPLKNHFVENKSDNNNNNNNNNNNDNSSSCCPLIFFRKAFLKDS